MKSCLDCKHGKETMFDECRLCTNEKSVYYGKLVDERDLCRECKEVGGMNRYSITLEGCDDYTPFEMVLTENEFELLKKVSELSKETSTYQCMPIMEIEEEEE